MGQSEWVQAAIRNQLDQTIVLANCSLSWGKYYDINNPYQEIQSPQGTQIQSKSEFTFGACGRQDSPSGTEGTFQLQIDGSNETIAEIYFNCPWGVGVNQISTKFVQSGYIVSFSGFNYTSAGPLGNGTISVVED